MGMLGLCVLQIVDGYVQEIYYVFLVFPSLFARAKNVEGFGTDTQHVNGEKNSG